MIDPKVVEYIKSATAKGVSRDEIIKSLMHEGGRTIPDIQAHFLAAEQGAPVEPVGPVQNIQSPNLQTRPKTKLGIYKLNLGIFVVEGVLGVISPYVFGDFALFFIPTVFFLHFVTLIGLSITELLKGITQKRKTDAGRYFLTAIGLVLSIVILGFLFSFYNDYTLSTAASSPNFAN